MSYINIESRLPGKKDILGMTVIFKTKQLSISDGGVVVIFPVAEVPRITPGL